MLTVKPLGAGSKTNVSTRFQSDADTEELDVLVHGMSDLAPAAPPAVADEASWVHPIYVEPPKKQNARTLLSRSGRRTLSSSRRGRRNISSKLRSSLRSSSASAVSVGSESSISQNFSQGYALPSWDPINPPGIGLSGSAVSSSRGALGLKFQQMQLNSVPMNIGIYEPPLAPNKILYEAAFERALHRDALIRNSFDSASSIGSNMTEECCVEAAELLSVNSSVTFTDRSNTGLEAFIRSAPQKNKQKDKSWGYLSRSELKKDVELLISSKHHVFSRWAQHGKGHECSASHSFMDDYEFKDTVLGGPFDDFRHELYKHNEKHYHAIRRALNHPDRDHWGAVVASLAHGWSPNTEKCWEAARDNLRYVVFNEEVRSAGYAMLLHESDAQGCYSMTKQLATDDILGLDFFVSHDWVDESASHRWQALCLISDEFKNRYGRWPRFWIDKFCLEPNSTFESKKGEGTYYRTEIVAVVIATAREFLLLQDPHALGSFEPSQKPAISVVYELYFATLFAPRKRDLAKEILGPVQNILVLKLFWGRTIPPPLDLLDGVASIAVRDSRGDIQDSIMNILMRLPGGLHEVQRAVASVFQIIHASEYHDWNQLRTAAHRGDFAKMDALLEAGCYPYALLPVGSELSPLAIACMAYGRDAKVQNGLSQLS